MKNALMIVAMVLIMSIVSAGSFGEYSSPNGVMTFNASNPTNTWTLVSTFNTSIDFYVTIGSSLNGVITTEVMSGTIPANSVYPITVTATSFDSTKDGVLTAYVNTTQNANGATIQLATSKIVKIQATPKETTTQTSSGGSGNNGGGSFAGGSSYTPSNDETLTFSGQPLIIRRTASNQTVTLTITNNGSALGPFTYRETIPYNVTSDDLTFSLQPNSFETGSLIAVWNFNGLNAGNSYTISYTFKNRNVGNLAKFKSGVSETPKVVKPEAPKKNTTPVVLNDETPAIWVPTKLTETMTNISDPSLPNGTIIPTLKNKESDMTVPLAVIVLFAVIVGGIVMYITGGKKPPVEPKEPVMEAPTVTQTPVEEIKEGEIVG